MANGINVISREERLYAILTNSQLGEDSQRMEQLREAGKLKSDAHANATREILEAARDLRTRQLARALDVAEAADDPIPHLHQANFSSVNASNN
jgi:hypothetical protein